MTMLEWLNAHSGSDYGNFIDGSWTVSASGRSLPLFHSARPAEQLGTFADSDAVDVDRAVAAAARAFPGWSATPAPERAALLLRFADLLEGDVEELAYRLSAEQGKPLAESRGEVMRAAKETRFAAGEALRAGGEHPPAERAGVMNVTAQVPVGVVAAIAPWNFPVVTPVRKIAPALAYGCTVVYKPASATPWASARLMELLAASGLPAGVVNMVTGSGSRVGNALVEHPQVRAISFTGSTKQGIAIQEKAARRLVKTQLELGGKNPAVVLDYSDLDGAAAQIVAAAYACSGQRCTAISRVVVLRGHAAELKQHLERRIREIRLGPAWADGVDMGPLINKSHLASVQAYIEAGQAEGATLVCGGGIPQDEGLAEGSYLTPALFTDVTPSMRIAREEIFGPVLSVLVAGDEQEAVEIANATDYGLAATIFADRLDTVHRVAAQLDFGMVHINHGTASAAHLPFGGVKQSGFGSYSIGSSNQSFYTDTKVVYMQY